MACNAVGINKETGRLVHRTCVDRSTCFDERIETKVYFAFGPPRGSSPRSALSAELRVLDGTLSTKRRALSAASPMRQRLRTELDGLVRIWLNAASAVLTYEQRNWKRVVIIRADQSVPATRFDGILRVENDLEAKFTLRRRPFRDHRWQGFRCDRCEPIGRIHRICASWFFIVSGDAANLVDFRDSHPG